jgi:nitrate reductase gamma subunit
MNLRLGQKLLVIGAGLLGFGIILVIVTFIMIGQSSYSFSTATQPISGGESFNETIQGYAGVDMTVAVQVQPSEIPMQLQVTQPGGEFVSDVSFNDRTFASFKPSVDGNYTMIITNLSSEQAVVNTLVGTNQANIALGAMAISGPILGGIGVIVIIIGTIVYFIRDRRQKERVT